MAGFGIIRREANPRGWPTSFGLVSCGRSDDDPFMVVGNGKIGGISSIIEHSLLPVGCPSSNTSPGSTNHIRDTERTSHSRKLHLGRRKVRYSPGSRNGWPRGTAAGGLGPTGSVGTGPRAARGRYFQRGPTPSSDRSPEPCGATKRSPALYIPP